MSTEIRPIILFADSIEFVSLVKDFSGTSPMTLESTTILKHNVKSRIDKRPFAEVFKGEVFSTKREYVFFGANYENAVNNQRSREDKANDFTAQELPWGQWYQGSSVVIEHKENFYLRYYVKMSANYKYSEKLYHYEDGTLLTKEEIDVFFAEFAPPAKDGGEYQDLDKPICPRSVKVEGITRARFAGKTLVRKGFESREDKKTLKAWHDLAEQEIDKRSKAVGAVA